MVVRIYPGEFWRCWGRAGLTPRRALEEGGRGAAQDQPVSMAQGYSAGLKNRICRATHPDGKLLQRFDFVQNPAANPESFRQLEGRGPQPDEKATSLPRYEKCGNFAEGLVSAGGTRENFNTSGLDFTRSFALEP